MVEGRGRPTAAQVGLDLATGMVAGSPGSRAAHVLAAPLESVPASCRVGSMCPGALSQ
ncbi:hypothetical protein RB201_01415 [Streptomyces sp. S1A(2023)]